MTRKIILQSYIRRQDLRNHQDWIYLFGDNLAGYGSGGQAGEMRDEPNAIGIPTKKLPSHKPGSYFTDLELGANVAAIDAAFALIPADKTIVIPTAGLGTGLADLKNHAPNTFAYLQRKLDLLIHGGDHEENK